MKAKTKKIVAKRFKVTKTGKLLRGKQNSRHLRNNKSKRQKRRYKKNVPVAKGMQRMVKSFLPYS